MRPLFLEIEGFSVYRKKQIIDFSLLNFFVIQGKTGAGKTSIVDAITYALYGKVPRYHGSSKQINTKVISKGSDTMKVSLEFLVKGKKYKIERFFSLKPKQRTVVRIYEEGKRLDLRLKDKEIENFIEKIIGMNYDVFTKVILLPQGEFDKFLKPSKPSERREILLKLLGINFELIQKKATEIYRELTGEYKELEREFESLQEISPDRLKDLQQTLNSLLQKERMLKDKLEKLERSIDKAKKYEELKSTYESLKRKYGELQEKQKEISVLKNRLEEYKKIAPFIPYINMLENIERDRRKYVKEKEEIERLIFSLSKDIHIANEDLKKKSLLKEEIPKLKDKLEVALLIENKLKDCLEKQESIKRYELQLKNLYKEKEELSSDIKTLGSRIEKGLKLTEELKTEIEELKKYEDILPFALEIEQSKNLLNEINEKISIYKKNIKEYEKKLKEKLIYLGRIKNQKAEIEIKLKELTIYKIRSELSEGDICPVCGNIYKEDGKQITVEIDIKEITDSLEKLKIEEEKTAREVGNIEGSIKEIKNKLEELNKESKNLASKINSFRYKDMDISKIKEHVNILRDKRSKLSKYQEKLMTLQRELSHKNNLYTQKESEIKSIKEKIEEYKSYIKDTLEWAKEVKTAKGNMLTEIYEEVSNKISSLKKKIETIEREYEKAKEKVENLRKEEVKLKEKKDNIVKILRDIEAQHSELSEKISDILIEYGSINKVKELVIDENIVKDWENKIKNFERDKEIVIKNLKETEEKLKEFKDVEDLEYLLKEKERSEKELSELQKSIGSIIKEKEYMEELQKKKDQILLRKREIEKKMIIYERIKNDLRSDKLQNFTSNLMLTKLVDSANAYFYDFTGTYSFDIDESGNIMIVDHSLPYDNKRVVDSLSGGETFIASLCLALGMSDVLSYSSTLESLFIDEGFGSLDEETREKAGETLEMLKTRINRMIGIITHIQDLAERFDQKILVRKKGNTSTIEVIY